MKTNKTTKLIFKLTFFLIVLGLSKPAFSVINTSENQGSSEYESCGIKTGGLVEFVKHKNGKLVNKLKFYPHNAKTPISLDYPNSNIGVYPNTHSDPCKTHFNKPAMYVHISNKPAEHLLVQLLEYHITLPEYEQDEHMVLFESPLGFGYLYAKGISCSYLLRHGSNSNYRCSMYILDDLKSTSSMLMPMPKPRMGAGNAIRMLKAIRR